MATGVSDAGYKAAEAKRFQAATFASILRTAVAAAQFALSAYDAVTNYRKLYKISSRALAVEEAMHGFVRDNYWPAELQFLNEFTQDTEWEDRATLAKRYAGRLWAPLAAKFSETLNKLNCNRARYCGSEWARAIQTLLATRAIAKANVLTLADQLAFAEVQHIQDTDFSRKQAALAMKQGLMSQAASLYATAAQGLASAASDSAAQATSALEAIGYNLTRNNRQPDPFFHAAVAQDARAASAASAAQSNGDPIGAWLNLNGLIDTDGGGQYTSATPENSLSGDDPYTGGLLNYQDWKANTNDQVQSSVHGATPRDTARSGKATWRYPGGTGAMEWTFDMDQMALTGVDGYGVDTEQTGPSSMPGAASGNVTYS